MANRHRHPPWPLAVLIITDSDSVGVFTPIETPSTSLHPRDNTSSTRANADDSLSAIPSSCHPPLPKIRIGQVYPSRRLDTLARSPRHGPLKSVSKTWRRPTGMTANSASRCVANEAAQRLQERDPSFCRCLLVADVQLLTVTSPQMQSVHPSRT